MGLSEIARGMRREVYRNLHWKDETVYSVRKCSDGLVEGHSYTIILDGNTSHPVTFAVGPKGNQRVRDEQRKNVHAVIRGCIVNAVWAYADMDASEKGHAKDACDYFKGREMNDREGYKWIEVLYNPYKYKTFMTRDTNPLRGTIEDVIEPIYTARKVIIGPKVWAQVLIENEGN
jgi:hypothetical protein